MRILLTLMALTLLTVPAFALDYGQDVTPNVIFGGGNFNGSFTTFTDSNNDVDFIEVGLRAKVRFNDADCAPENTFNNWAANEYYFKTGVPTCQSGITPTWSFEWTVNTNAAGGGMYKVGHFTYELGLDYNPAGAVVDADYVKFDPIITDFADHAFGDNSTPQSGGLVASDATQYGDFLSDYNVVQQSWRYSWFDQFGTFNPNENGVYNIYLKVFANGAEIAHTEIVVIVAEEPVATESNTWGQLKSLYR